MSWIVQQDVFSSSYCMASNDGIMCVNNELTVLWKEVFVA